ncbi:MAG: hypothetical protein AAAC47_06835 [Pararhizobium sp.]
MTPTFREWLDEHRNTYRTAHAGMSPSAYIEACLLDLSNAFIDYADEVLAKRLKGRE